MAGNLEQQQQPADQDNCAGAGAGDMAAAPKRKVRMHPDDVRFTLSLKREDLGGTEFLDLLAHKFTPEEIDEKRRLHEELVAIFRKDDEELEARQAEVARELAEKGYVEIDEVDPADEAEFDRLVAEQWKTMTDTAWFKSIEFADPRDVQSGWTVRRFDAEEDDEFEDEDEDEDEDGEQVEDEDEDEDEDGEQVEDEDEDEDGEQVEDEDEDEDEDGEQVEDEDEDEDGEQVEDEAKVVGDGKQEDTAAAALESN